MRSFRGLSLAGYKGTELQTWNHGDGWRVRRVHVLELVGLQDEGFHFWRASREVEYHTCLCNATRAQLSFYYTCLIETVLELLSYKHKQSSELLALHPHRCPVLGISHAPPLLNHVYGEFPAPGTQIEKIKCTNPSLFFPVENRN